MSEEQKPAFKPLWHLMSREKVSIGTLASAIQKNGIQGWDRFGRFDTFKTDSTDPDHAARCARVLDALAAQHEFEEMPHGAGRSPLDEAEDYAGSGHPFEYGWLEGHAALDFSAIVAGAAKQPVQPKQVRANNKGENYNLKLIGALVGFIAGEISANAHPDYDKAAGMKGLGGLLANKYGTASAEVYGRRLSLGVQALKDATV